MAIAMLHPEPAKVKRKGSGSVGSTEPGFSRERLSHARTIFREAPDLARSVLSGIGQQQERPDQGYWRVEIVRM